MLRGRRTVFDGCTRQEKAMERLLTFDEVAELIRVPAATLRYWRHRGTGPKSFKMGPRRVMYRERDVLQWIDGQYARGSVPLT